MLLSNFSIASVIVSVEATFCIADGVTTGVKPVSTALSATLVFIDLLVGTLASLVPLKLVSTAIPLSSTVYPSAPHLTRLFCVVPEDLPTT